MYCVLLGFVLLSYVQEISTASLNPSFAAFELQATLEYLLTNDSYNLYKLQTTFYPTSGHAPFCVPVTFSLVCNCAAQSVREVGDVNCSTEYNATFLWTSYDTSTPVGKLVLAYALGGIMVNGFSWEGLCLLNESVQLTIGIVNNSCTAINELLGALQEIATKIKAYALYRGSIIALNNDDTRGYAIHVSWKEDYGWPFYYIVVVVIIVLTLFVFLLSATTARFAYEMAYDSVKGKQRPGYPIFWGFTTLCFLWDIAPSWLVLNNIAPHIVASLILLIALLLMVAVLIPKRVDFPIPCAQACKKHMQCVHTVLGADIFKCRVCFISFLIQSLVIWFINVFLALCAFYAIGVLVALFLYPILTLVKLFFVKAVVICVVLNTALLISTSRFTQCCRRNSAIQNLQSLALIGAPVLFLCLLSFVALLIGNIVFTVSAQAAGIQSIFTIILPLLLVFFAWFSRGALFPDGITETDPAAEIIHDIENGLSPHSNETSKLLGVNRAAV